MLVPPFFFSSRRRHTRSLRDWSSDVCSSDLQLSWWRRLVTVILPSAAPAIVAGLRISIGSSWVAIVAAEMLIGGTGVGYFVWNEWNNLQLTSVIFAILAIGVIGVALDAGVGRLSRKFAYAD